MIDVKGIPDYIDGDKEKAILENHINTMLKKCVVFIGIFTEKNNKRNFLKKKERYEFRKRLCPNHIKEDKARENLILSLIRKIYDEDKRELTVDEKFVLFRTMQEAIEREEHVISELATEDNLKLDNWIWGRYKIEDTDDRRAILAILEKNNIGPKEYPKELLEEKTVMERNLILDAIGQPNMLVFEYPHAINLVFSHTEYELLANIHQHEMEERFEK